MQVYMHCLRLLAQPDLVFCYCLDELTNITRIYTQNYDVLGLILDENIQFNNISFFNLAMSFRH
jgi:hypothetical protein